MAGRGNGNAGEGMVLAALVGRGFRVLIPFGEGAPYDLAIDLESGAFLRVQCKTGWPRGGCLIFNPYGTDHGHGQGSYAGEADVFGVYFPPLHGVYLVPLDAVARSEGRLRLEPARNNQRRRVRLAAEYEIDRWSDEDLAALAAEPREAPLAPALGREAPAAVA